MRSKDYLYPLTQTICRTLQISMKARNFREDEADIYPAFEHEELQHANFPCQLPTNHLKEIFDLKIIRALKF